jgi:hypothetical protein
MKFLKLSISAALLLTTVSAFAAGGTDRGNPGDEYAKSFTGLGYDLVDDLAKDPLPGVDASALLKVVQATTLHSEASLELRGFPVDAINYPDPVAPSIVVSRLGWDRMALESHRRAFLVLHEYLAIMGVDDSKYQVSSLLDRAQVCSRNPVIREAIERELKKSCYRVVQDDLRYVVILWLHGKGIDTLKTSDFAGINRLENLNLSGNPISSVEPGFFENFPRLNSLETGTAVDSLENCSFLRSMPALTSADFGTIMGYPGIFHPLRKIAASCFAPFSHLINLTLEMDGATSPSPGFLKGLSESVRLLLLRGTNLDRIDPIELASPSPRLELHFSDHVPAQKFVDAISKATGKKCSVSEQTDRYGAIPHYWALACGELQ